MVMGIAMRILRKLQQELSAAIENRRGTSAIEFAIAAPLLLAILVPTADLGMGFYTRMQVQNAAQAGAQWAVLHQTFDSNAIENAVTNATNLASITASPAPAQSCGCADGTGITAIACGSTCPNGAAAGSYATVSAQAPYTPLIPYPMLGASITLSAQSTVRYQ